MNYALLALLWIVWCCGHSLFASCWFKDVVKARAETLFGWYRLLYNLAALITLWPVMQYQASLRGYPFFQWDGNLSILRLLLLACVVLIALTAATQYDMPLFLGIRHVSQEQPAAEPFVRTGILGMTRHPWYLVAFPYLWVQTIDTSKLIMNLVLTAYLIIGTLLEERKLVMEYGEMYRDYQRHVSMFFPYIWLRSILKYGDTFST